MEFIREFYLFAMSRKKLWILPLLAVMLVIGLLLVFSTGTAVAPFIYTLF